MGLMSRMSTIFKSKVSATLDSVEDPRQTLDYSYERQMELLQQVKRSLADAVTSRKQIEMQKVRLEADIQKYQGEAEAALKVGREDLARAALERKAATAAQVQGLDAQIAELKGQEGKMEEAARRLETKIASFRAQKEVIKAQYTTAQAQVKMGEAATGVSEELADVGLAMQRAQDKTEHMRARAQAIDELSDQGVLEDPLTPQADPIERELHEVHMKSQVEDDLAALKAKIGAGEGQ
ncbi:MAG: PspA/IM30 family protein [Thermaerobacter sp.]|nr:PspA/IM30 family protein [Thermaerobacter sp.]